MVFILTQLMFLNEYIIQKKKIRNDYLSFNSRVLVQFIIATTPATGGVRYQCEYPQLERMINEVVLLVGALALCSD